MTSESDGRRIRRDAKGWEFLEPIWEAPDAAQDPIEAALNYVRNTYGHAEWHQPGRSA